MKIIPPLALVFCSFHLFAQEDLMKELEQNQKPQTDIVTSTFKGTRLVNGQTVETKGKGALEFIFAHRFGAINSGIYNLYGLDNAHVRIGLEYGLTDRLGVSIGRNSLDKTVDGFLRYKILRQTTGAVNFPVTITAYGNAACKTSPPTADAAYPIKLQDRMAYVGQILIARKFSSKFSLQLMPTIVHKNTVDKTIENNDQIALGAGTRFKITRSVALTSEYYYRFNVMDTNPYYNSVGVGIDIETGGHVFQLVMSNSQGLTERAFITEATGKVGNGGIHLGFNVTRTFQLKKQQ
jgi:opacity protein-like surface antigen